MIKNILLIFWLFAAIIPAGWASAAECGLFRHKYSYPVETPIDSKLVGLIGARLAAFAFDGQAWQQVPFQVGDPPESELALLEESLVKVTRPNSGGTDLGPELRGDDRLVFTGSDLGVDFSLSRFPTSLLTGAESAWRLRFCNAQRFYGSVLLIAYEKNAPVHAPSPRVFVDDDQKQIVTNYYRKALSEFAPLSFGELSYLNDEKQLEVLFESIKAQIVFNTPRWLPRWGIGSEDLRVVQSYQRSDSISTTRIFLARPKGILGVLGVRVRQHLTFYENIIRMRLLVTYGNYPKTLIQAGTGVAIAVSFADKRDWDLATNLVQLPVRSPENAHALAERSDSQPNFFVRGERPEGRFAAFISIDAKLASQVTQPYLLDREMFAARVWQDRWPWLRQLDGDMGFFVDFSAVRQVSYDFTLDLILGSGAEQGPLGAIEPVVAHWIELPLNQ